MFKPTFSVVHCLYFIFYFASIVVKCFSVIVLTFSRVQYCL